MERSRFFARFILTSAISAAAPAQSQENSRSSPPPASPTPPPSSMLPLPFLDRRADPAADKRAQLEEKFKHMLSGAVLEGVWQMTGPGGLSEKSPLSPPKSERYEITAALKSGGDLWIITARIQYADKNVHVPVPVHVLWAGDTPVLTLDEVNIPLLGSYSARVIFHEGFYSGIWYSKSRNYGGIMSGRITRLAPALDSPGRQNQTPTEPQAVPAADDAANAPPAPENPQAPEPPQDSASAAPSPPTP